MDKEQIIRAWKDEEYRSGLGEAESALLPQNPAGVIELLEGELGVVGREDAAFTGKVCDWFSVEFTCLARTCKFLGMGCAGE